MNAIPLVLIVDDDPANRVLLKRHINKLGYQSMEAVNGVEAVTMFRQHSVDVVLMDVMMPEMDGYQAARIIKDIAHTFVPVIFLTGLTEDSALARCIESGGDDFLTRPYNHLLLKAKLESMLRISRLYHQVEYQKNELDWHHERIQQESSVAKKVFSNIIASDFESMYPGLNYSMSPMSMFNGDLVLAELNQANGIDIMVSDFTGHGLSAAIGSIPVSDTFRTMTRKGFHFTEVLAEINKKLLRILPTHMFMASALVSIDRDNQVVSVANMGLPDIYLCRDKKVIHNFKSENLPLGISKLTSHDVDFKMQSLKLDDVIVAATDGIMEAINSDGEFYGKQRIVDSIERSSEQSEIFNNILNDCVTYIGSSQQNDDITLLTVQHTEDEFELGDRRELDKPQPADWSIHLYLDAVSLRRFDVMPYLLQGIQQLQKLDTAHSEIQTILTEMYANALDHGLLKLDSRLKHTPEGYMEFYNERSRRLEKLEEGSIQIIIKHEMREGGGGRFSFHIYDSGEGFDFTEFRSSLEENKSFYGRGLMLIEKLSDEVHFLGKGNAVMVVYDWD